MHKLTTVRFGALVCLAIFLAGCAGKKMRVPTPSAPLSQAAKDELITLKAEQIENQKKIDKIARQARKTETPAKKQARKEVEHANNRAIKIEEHIAEAHEHAGLSGCSWNEVTVDPIAERYTKLFPMVYVRFLNNTPYKMNIESAALAIGNVVTGLCPGASISLFFSAQDWYTTSDYTSITLVAKAQPKNSALIAESRTLTLYRRNFYQLTQDAGVWEVTRRQ